MTDKQQLQDHLHKEIKAAHEASKQPLSSESVAAIVRQVIESLGSHVSTTDVRIFSEIEDLARYIRQAKQDILAIQPKDISTDHIPRATDELDAVVGATEEATNKIMDVCDEMTVIGGSCTPEINEKLIGCTTKIFEACNFQDITGQRITKVVETLKHIDMKIEALVLALGDEMHHAGVEGKGSPKKSPAADPEKDLLNGPQLPKNATTQDDIDRMMSGQ